MTKQTPFAGAYNVQPFKNIYSNTKLKFKVLFENNIMRQRGGIWKLTLANLLGNEGRRDYLQKVGADVCHYNHIL